jgi:hypothetical protein
MCEAYVASRLQVVVCECNHLTDFTYMDETFNYMGLTLTYFEKVGFEKRVRSTHGAPVDVPVSL